MYDYFDNRRNLFVTGSRALLEEATAGADGVLRVFVVNGIEPVQRRVSFFRQRTRRSQTGDGLAGIFLITCQQLAGNI